MTVRAMPDAGALQHVAEYGDADQGSEERDTNDGVRAKCEHVYVDHSSARHGGAAPPDAQCDPRRQSTRATPASLHKVRDSQKMRGPVGPHEIATTLDRIRTPRSIARLTPAGS